MIYRGAVLIFSLMWASSAFANSVSDARALFISGEYDAAIEMATESGTPEGLVLAAETLSAKVMLSYVDDPNESAQQARHWAEDAVEALPNSREARVQYALAYGFETRTSSPFRAWRKGLPGKTLEAIEQVISAYPDDARGPALLGAWHLGIVRKAGEKNGLKWYDATEEAGVAAYEAALKMAPNDVVIGSNYAVTIIALDAEKYFERAEEVLKTVVDAKAANAVEREVQKRMKVLLGLSDDKDALSAAVAKLVDG